MEREGVELAMGVFFIEGEAFLHALDRSLKCHHAVVLGTVRKGEGYNKEVFYQGLDDVMPTISSEAC